MAIKQYKRAGFHSPKKSWELFLNSKYAKMFEEHDICIVFRNDPRGKTIHKNLVVKTKLLSRNGMENSQCKD